MKFKNFCFNNIIWLCVVSILAYIYLPCFFNDTLGIRSTSHIKLKNMKNLKLNKINCHIRSVRANKRFFSFI